MTIKMTMVKWLFSFGALFFSLTSCASAPQLFETSTQKTYYLEAGIKQMPADGFVILGETHYQEDIQNAQGLFIEKAVQVHGLENNFTVAWEFLNYPDQSQLEEKYSLYKEGQLEILDLLRPFFGKNADQHLVYEPLFASAALFGGKMVATNAPRAWKSKIVQGGLQGLDPQYIPSNMERGPKEYFDRFKVVMGGHAPADKVENYFLAQSYADAVMAKSLVDLSEGNMTFMAVGHFHSDFDHGLQSYLRKLTNRPVVHVRLVDFKGLSEEERQEILKGDAQYGALAPWLLIVNP